MNPSLHPLVGVQHPLEELGHEGLEVDVVRLVDDPVGVAGERPAGDGADERLGVGQAVDEVRDQLGQVRDHAGHAALGDGAQRQDARLLHFPLLVEERLLRYKANIRNSPRLRPIQIFWISEPDTEPN